MANAIEDTLNRASEEQRARAQKVIEEVRHNIKLVSMQETITQADADTANKNAQVIEDAKRTIPFDTMQEVETISPPLPTPKPATPSMDKVVNLHPQTQSTIEQIEQGEGNN